MRPPAPWDILDIDLALPDQRPPEVLDRPALLHLRYRGAVLERAFLLPTDLPMTDAEFSLFAARHIRWTVSELLALEGRVSLLSPTHTSRSSKIDTLPESPLARLDETLQTRRARKGELTASIVICTRHRARELDECLQHLTGELAEGREVIVVDNGDDEHTRSVVARHSGVTYVSEPETGLNRARNTGLKHVRSDVACFIDDDVRPEPGWVDALLTRFTDERIGVVCGLVLPYELQTQAQIDFEYHLGFGGMGLVPWQVTAEAVAEWPGGFPVWTLGAGANMAVRCETARELGGFDERIGAGAIGGAGDDSEFWYRVLQRYDAGYEPLSVVRHKHRRSVAELRSQAEGYSFGHVVALFVQFAGARNRNQLERVFIHLPRYHLGRVKRWPRNRLLGRRDPLLGCEIRGYLRALRFQLRASGRSAARGLRRDVASGS